MMIASKPLRVGIVGAGPAGATLACLLAKKGVDAVFFDDGKRPDMVVGESLVPRLVNVFRHLGIEEEVAKLGTYKPGVTWIFDENDALELSFTAMRGVLPTYAYNVPRREFDDLVHETALKAGARFIPCDVKLQVGTTERGEKVPRLSPETLALVPDWKGQQPDLLVDASGRRRLFAKLLGIKAAIGDRKDVSHFAHYENCEMPKPEGQAVITRLKHGWSWRIPLRNALSIGVVFDKEHAKQYGKTPEEQLEAVIDQNKPLAEACMKRKRITPVTTYANYQLISEQAHGDGWVCVGDAFGFVDPMLSPGLCMAMTSAEELAEAIVKNRPGNWDRAFQNYLDWFRDMLCAWQELVDLFYGGHIFALQRTGTRMSQMFPGKISMIMQRHFEKNISGMAGGGLTNHPYSRNLLRFMTRFAIYDENPADYAVV
ncbi:Dehydrogenase (flavoprotein) [Prosthecobacter debontii]|uniref:Dehydrogenase (Flavoprotein) n=1 Tax=Prosthecobacter debontii TaxID=48467 RepID=A0A1T4YCM6_9BACT|nr:NAD(P)/FAD-dependent oxidoreductase [Prosthecobacter debontii]SKA99278.1 Dehydrogenase (flavoprotein) [Prosthecobacter debontii]